MIKTTVTLAEVIAYLNELVAADPEAIGELVESRTPCNRTLAEHPIVQVLRHLDGSCSIGILGILNGLFGVDQSSWGTIAAIFEVVCPRGHEVPPRSTVREQCAQCKSQLGLGKLEGFRDIGRR